MSLYSAFIIDAESGGEPYNLFEYGLGQQVVGCKRVATRAYTNVPRPSHAGLPMGWHAVINSWRVVTNQRHLDEAVLDWAAETTCRLQVGSYSFKLEPLLNLLMAPQPVNDPRGTRDGAHLLENINYSVQIDQLSLPALDKLKAHLVENTNTGRLIVWVYLDGRVTYGPI